jgi:hypothetical protein
MVSDRARACPLIQIQSIKAAKRRTVRFITNFFWVVLSSNEYKFHSRRLKKAEQLIAHPEGFGMHRLADLNPQFRNRCAVKAPKRIVLQTYKAEAETNLSTDFQVAPGFSLGLSKLGIPAKRRSGERQ